MLKLFKGLPGNVIGVSASGEVTERDYDDVLIPEVDKRIEKYGKIRLLYHLGREFESFSGNAVWDDIKLGIRRMRKFDRIAIVTDNDLYRAATKMLSMVIPAEIRTFDSSDLANAKAWITDGLRKMSGTPNGGKHQFL